MTGRPAVKRRGPELTAPAVESSTWIGHPRLSVPWWLADWPAASDSGQPAPCCKLVVRRTVCGFYAFCLSRRRRWAHWHALWGQGQSRLRQQPGLPAIPERIRRQPQPPFKPNYRRRLPRTACQPSKCRMRPKIVLTALAILPPAPAWTCWRSGLAHPANCLSLAVRRLPAGLDLSSSWPNRSHPTSRSKSVWRSIVIRAPPPDWPRAMPPASIGVSASRCRPPRSLRLTSSARAMIESESATPL